MNFRQQACQPLQESKEIIQTDIDE